MKMVNLRNARKTEIDITFRYYFESFRTFLKILMYSTYTSQSSEFFLHNLNGPYSKNEHNMFYYKDHSDHTGKWLNFLGFRTKNLLAETKLGKLYPDN